MIEIKDERYDRVWWSASHEFDERDDLKARWSSNRKMRQGEYENWKDER
jgi:hypothetical protein